MENFEPERVAIAIGPVRHRRAGAGAEAATEAVGYVAFAAFSAQR
jgi:hypothetical protein